jgi:hypothetical protein
VPAGEPAGVPLDLVALQTPHKRLSALIDRYIRPAQALEAIPSRDLRTLTFQSAASTSLPGKR